jgi:probable HAF family extracellular repeat protein
MTDLGPFSANAINNTGQVVGSNGHAVVYSNGQIIDLGTMGHFFSAAVGVNDFSQVVGFAYNPSSPGNNSPFLYREGQVLDLNTLIAAGQGVRLNQATAINNRGQIVATGFGSGTDLDEVYLLTPTSSAVPEPNMLAMCGLTFIAMLAAKRQEKTAPHSYPLGSIRIRLKFPLTLRTKRSLPIPFACLRARFAPAFLPVAVTQPFLLRRGSCPNQLVHPRKAVLLVLLLQLSPRSSGCTIPWKARRASA